MKFFKEMIDVEKVRGWGDDNEAHNLFFEAVSRAEVFVFSPTKKIDPTDPANIIADDVAKIFGVERKREDHLECACSDDELLTLPFGTMSIEIAGDNFITVSSYRDKLQDGVDVRIACLLIHELSPGKFVCFAYNKIFKDGKLLTKIILKTSDEWALSLVKVFAKRINVEPEGYEKSKDRIKFNRGSGREIREIKYVIHVCPSRLRDDYRSDSGREIDWKCRFLRRGHWARFWKDKELGVIDESRIGKDREGNYCIQGMTWHVEAVVNQDREDLPLVRKQRIVHADGKKLKSIVSDT